MTVGEHELDLVRRAIDAFNRGDREVLAALFVPEPEIRPVRAALDGTIYRGPTAVDDFLTSADEIFSDPHVDADELIPMGDGVFFAGLFYARGASSGAEAVLPAAWSVTFRDGLVAALRTWTNRADALRDLGVEP